ncbi:hypothetical protein BC829DRAFT_179931 [Chytridium lagenaria]|nr:hypothetical protein BC829DRAFT_179931 [Chytridium lagenaria]
MASPIPQIQAPPPGFLLISSVGFTNTLINYSANACVVLWTSTLIFDCIIHIKVFSVRVMALVAILSLMAASLIRVHFWSWRLVDSSVSYLIFMVELILINIFDLVAKSLVACIFRLKAVAIFEAIACIQVISWIVFSVYIVSVIVASSTFPFSAIRNGSFELYSAYNAARPEITIATNVEPFLKGILILAIDIGLLVRLRKCISTDTLSQAERVYKYTKLLSTIICMILLVILCFISSKIPNISITWIFANNVSAVLPIVQIIDFYKYDVKILDPNFKSPHQQSVAHTLSPVHTMTRLRRNSMHPDAPFLTVNNE